MAKLNPRSSDDATLDRLTAVRRFLIPTVVLFVAVWRLAWAYRNHLFAWLLDALPSEDGIYYAMPLLETILQSRLAWPSAIALLATLPLITLQLWGFLAPRSAPVALVPAALFLSVSYGVCFLGAWATLRVLLPAILVQPLGVGDLVIRPLARRMFLTYGSGAMLSVTLALQVAVLVFVSARARPSQSKAHLSLVRNLGLLGILGTALSSLLVPSGFRSNVALACATLYAFTAALALAIPRKRLLASTSHFTPG